jgi:anaerobic selenocysteine-containing dehydrogenase
MPFFIPPVVPVMKLHFLYQLFVREFGTNNFPDCSNMCHEPSGYAMREAIGSAKAR